MFFIATPHLAIGRRTMSNCVKCDVPYLVRLSSKSMHLVKYIPMIYKVHRIAWHPRRLFCYAACNCLPMYAHPYETYGCQNANSG